MKKSSQLITWICVGSLTVSLHAAALWLIVIPQELPEKVEIQEQKLDLSFLLPPAPAPEPTPEPVPQPAPIPEPEPEPTPEPEPPVITPPERIEPPKPPPPPKPDPAIVKKELEKKKAAEQKARDRASAEARDRAIAKKRMDEKRNKAREAAAKAKAKARAIANAKAAAAKRAADAKRIVSKPSAISQKKPRYPSIALRAGHQGTTTLRLTIGSNGRVTSASVSKSSGHSSLDQAALSVVRSWRFKPARNGAGQAVSYTMTQSVPFRIR